MHTYATLHEAKRYAVDEGIAWGEGSTNDHLALAILESVSRRVDGWTRRSAFGSGFGPRLGTNRYDSTGCTSLDFDDDLLSTDSVLSRASTASSTTTAPAEETDFYLVNNKGQYEPGPYRKAILHGLGNVLAFGSGLRVVEWTGVWGHQDVTVPLVPAAGEAIDDDQTDIEVSALGEISPGMTLLVDDEQMYVRALIDADPTFSITVVRGVNGTTAAEHDDESEMARYIYDPGVTEVTLRLWGKRWAARNSGADGSDGGGDVGFIQPRESEDTILRRTINHLRMLGPVVF